MLSVALVQIRLCRAGTRYETVSLRVGKEALSHHGHHGNHGGQGHSNFVSADFGEQMAAGGASKLNSKRAEYWDRWVERSNFLPLWQLAFLFACFIAVAAFPIVVEEYVTNHVLPQAQAQAQPESQPSQPAEMDLQQGQARMQPQFQPESSQQSWSAEMQTPFISDPASGRFDNRFGRSSVLVDR